ncbi:hypothetical protein [Bradyrhizobium guangzhouense]|uniref:hypothetical protein n=1 Tax=Bradyrhizobium guangzhouense TaxID=1325095 RepID=UPI001009BF24|nr:hypothetical protein [Bradyrhizobium guangzhouense]RXH15149.1 hypothetical protein EAS54_18860 [Bradyrhizobium guangzhouense]
MDFRPINSDHAVQSAAFNVMFDGPLDPAMVQSLRGRKDLLEDLPAVHNPEVFELIPGVGTRAQRAAGIQLSHLRPDGTAAWSLRIVGNELAVECGRYTRWDRVWESAQKYLAAGIEVARASERKAAVVALNVADAFIANQEEYDLKTLLRAGPRLAEGIFSSGPTWHNYVGWFRYPAINPKSHWLNQLNVDAARGADDIRVSVVHNQELRQDAPLSLPLTSLADWYRELHKNNKLVLTEILQPEMADKIGLKI